jgi:pSer/pThr/pTyr-binding forkhead associated (FHA) protein
VAATQADSDQTDPNARVEGFDGEDRTVAGDLGDLGDLGLDDELFVQPEGDKTQVYNAASAEAGASEYKLLVLAGPKAGAEFPLAETVMTLGRAPDNHVSIPDVSVSRKHVRFTRLGAEGYTVEDLGSGNGTKVNGDVIQGPVHLRHGDEVAMGDTTVQLVEVGVPVVKKKGAVKPSEAAATRLVPPDEARKAQAAVKAAQAKASAPASAPASAQAPASASLSPQKKKLYLGLFAGIVVLFAALAVIKGGGQEGEAEQDAAVDVSASVEEAMRLAGQGKWGEAEARLKELLEQSGGDPDVKTKYEKVKANVQAQRQVAQAKRALEGQEFAQARETLALVSKKTVFFDEARKLGEQVDAAVAQAAADAKAALSAGDKERAAAIADKVLAADAQNALALSVRAELEKKAGRKGPGTTEPGATRSRKGAEADKEQAEEADAPRGSSSALSMYLAGDLAGALRAADQGGDPILQRLRAFDQAFRDGAAKANANKSAEAVKSLAVAQKLDREISRGKPSKPGAEVGKALGNQEYLLGLDSKGDEQLARAAAHFSAAVEADPSNELYRKALDKTNAKVLEVYTQAYVARSTDPDSARRLFRIACEALPPSHEKHERACTFYKGLGGK